MTYDGVDIGEAVQPIQDRVETYQSNGYAVVSPGDALSAGSYAVTVNSGDLNASDTLTVGSSNDEIIFDGSVKSLSSATDITINGVSAAGDGTEQYRYDVIYADSSGEVQKTEGSVTKLDSRESQNNLTRFERFKAAIPNPGTDPSVIIAAVIINSNDTSVGTSQLRDYRVPATTTADTVDANTVDATTTNTANIDGGVTGNTTVSDIIGSGVEVVSGSLQAALGDGLDFTSGNIQILDSIWDAGNTELTADVNNTNTTTDTLEADGVTKAQVPQTTELVDDFNRGTLSYYSDASDYSVASNDPLYGPNHLQTTTKFPSPIKSPFKIQRGSRLRLVAKFDGNGDDVYGAYISETQSSNDDAYRFRVRAGEFSIVRFDGGSDTQLAKSTSISSQSGYRILDIDYGLESIDFKYKNLDGSLIASLSASDTNKDAVYIQPRLSADNNSTRTTLDRMYRRPL